MDSLSNKTGNLDMIESQEIEYKDFSKSPNFDKKAIVATLFKEITAFANSKGGKIIIGIDDKSLKETPQSNEVCRLLENDSITRTINKLSDYLVNFKSEIKNGIITITVSASDDPISCNQDTKGINKGDCFIRKNHETVKAVGNDLKKLIESKEYAEETKLSMLRSIVHRKFQEGKNNSREINIFDALVIISDTNDGRSKTLFDDCIFHQFVGGYSLPYSQYSNMNLYLNLMHAVLEESKTNEVAANFVKSRRNALDRVMSKKEDLQNFLNAHQEAALSSIALKVYIKKNTADISHVEK